MASCRQLPTELLIIIFGHLESSKAIAECRLVCKAWDDPATITMLGKPVNVVKRYHAQSLLDHLKSHPSKGQHVRHLTVDRYDGGDFLRELLQQVFTPNIEELGVGGYGFTSTKHFDMLYNLIIGIAENSPVKFDKLKKIPNFEDTFTGPSKRYKKAFWTFRGSLQFVRLCFTEMDEVQDLVYRLCEFKKLTSLDLQGYIANLTTLERVLKGCTHLEKLDLIANDFVVWEGQQWNDRNSLTPKAMLAWAKENVEQVQSMKTVIASSMGYPNLIEYLVYKFPNITKFVFDTFREESAIEEGDDFVSVNINRIFNTIKHLETFELHYQIPPGQGLQEVCELAQGDSNSMLIRYNVIGRMDTMLMHLTNTLLENGTRSATFDLEIPTLIEHFSHVEKVREMEIPIHSLELDFLNYSRDEDSSELYDQQLQTTEQSEMLFSILYNASGIKQVKALAHIIDGPREVYSLEELDVELESLELCSAQVTEDAFESIDQDCPVLKTLILTNCRLIPDDHNVYYISMESTIFDKFKLHTVPLNDVIKQQHKDTFEGEYEHVEQYARDVLQNVKKTWSKPCYLRLAVSSFKKEVFFKIIPGIRNTKPITQKAFKARNKHSFVLRLDCFSVKSLEINVGESHLSLDKRAIVAALKSRVSYPLEQDDMVEEETNEDE